MSYTPEEIKEAGLDDFRHFLYQVWDHLQLKDRKGNLTDPTSLQLDIAGFLQHGPDRRMVMGFRGVAKSWITVAFVLWTLLLDPQKSIMVVSASEGLANDFVRFARRLIDEMEMLQHLKPAPGDDKAEKFTVGPARAAKDPSVKSVSITGQLTGSRADVIVFDDVEVPKNSLTAAMREKIAKLVTEGDDVLKPDGHIIYLGTPQTEHSLYLLLPARGYTIRVWPSEIPEDTDKYLGRLAPYITKMILAGAKAHDPTEPTRFDTEDLEKRKLAKGLGSYMLQFMLDTSLSDADKRPLKCRDMIVTDVDAEGNPEAKTGPMGHIKYVWTRDREKQYQELHCGGMDGDYFYSPAWKSAEMATFTGTCMWIDPSGRGKDETAYAIVRYLLGKLFLVKVGGFLDGFGEKTLAAIAGAAGRYGVNDIIIEKNFGGGMFDKLFQPVLARVSKAKILDEEEFKAWSSTNKEFKICDTLEPILQSHRLVVDRRVIEEDWIQQQEDQQYSLIYQLSRMERTKGILAHEDRLEAVAGACSYYMDKMARDQDKVLVDHQSAALDAELKKWGDKKANKVVVGQQQRSGGDIRSCLR